MLKHVSYRSTASLNRGSPQSTSCRGSSVTPPGNLTFKSVPCTPDMPIKSSLRRFSIKDDSDSCDDGIIKDFEQKTKTLPSKDDLEDLSPLRNFKSPDSVSLTSSFSFASLASGRFSASRCSSTLSLSDPSGIPVKIHLRRLRSDMEYKTLSLSSATTCRELIHSLMTKFRLRHRDPNLFFVLMEVTVRSPTDSTPVKRLLVLDDDARPAELQQCRPKGEARFSIGVRRGGLVRVHDSILMQGSQYKSLLVSYGTSADELVRLLLNCYNISENHKHYSIHEVCKLPYKDRPLKGGECPLRVQADWPKLNKTSWSFVLRRNINYTLNFKSKLFWRRSLDQSSTDTESELEDHNTTRASIMSTASSASNASSSSGVSTDSLVSSSSGVSSGDSCLSSPMTTPQKPNSSPICPVTKSESSPTTSTPVSKTPPSPATRSSSPPPLPNKPSKPDVTPVRPPKPVPRTLFAPISNLSSIKTEVETCVDSDEEQDSAISSPSRSFKSECTSSYSDASSHRDKSADSVSYGSFSHSSPKRANIRSLSKSFMNLSFISPSSLSPSKSYFNAGFSPPPKSINSPLLKRKSLTLSQKNLTLNDSSKISQSSKLSSKSEYNLFDKSCLRHCDNCFYI